MGLPAAFEAAFEVTELGDIACQEVTVAGAESAAFHQGVEAGDGAVEVGAVIASAFPVALEVGQAFAHSVEAAQVGRGYVAKVAGGVV